MDIESRNKLLSIVLGIAIIALGYWLYISIVGPYQQVLEAERKTEMVRTRMISVKDALVRYQNVKDGFPPTQGGLDSLVEFLKTDSLSIAMGDSMYKQMPPIEYNPDSIIYNPITNNRFLYTLNDTLRPQLYLLEDPDSEDRIGDLERTTYLNAPNWN